ncbi:hypothetical protein GCM10023237_63210 [Streptomyces coeruleoprunus]
MAVGEFGEARVVGVDLGVLGAAVQGEHDGRGDGKGGGAVDVHGQLPRVGPEVGDPDEVGGRGSAGRRGDDSHAEQQGGEDRETAQEVVGRTGAGTGARQ